MPSSWKARTSTCRRSSATIGVSSCFPWKYISPKSTLNDANLMAADPGVLPQAGQRRGSRCARAQLLHKAEIVWEGWEGERGERGGKLHFASARCVDSSTSARPGQGASSGRTGGWAQPPIRFELTPNPGRGG